MIATANHKKRERKKVKEKMDKIPILGDVYKIWTAPIGDFADIKRQEEKSGSIFSMFCRLFFPNSNICNTLN